MYFYLFIGIHAYTYMFCPALTLSYMSMPGLELIHCMDVIESHSRCATT